MAGLQSPGHMALVVGLLLLHFILRPLFTAWPAGPDLLVGGLLLAALSTRAGYAAVLGLVLGLLEGSMAVTGMGQLMMVYAVAGYVGARSRDLLFSDSPTFVPVFLFVGVLLVETATGLALGAQLDARFFFLHMPAAALATAVVCWIGERAVSYLLRG